MVAAASFFFFFFPFFRNFQLRSSTLYSYFVVSKGIEAAACLAKGGNCGMQLHLLFPKVALLH